MFELRLFTCIMVLTCQVLLTMQDIFVSSVEGWHEKKIAQHEFYYSDFKFENVTCK